MSVKPIYNALSQLLQFKGWATVSELTKTSGKKPIQVLTTLNQNDSLIIKDKKTGKILRFADVASRQRLSLKNEGKVYIPGQTGYDEYKTLDYFGDTKNALFQVLYTKVRLGFLGDSHDQMVILDTLANRSLLEKHGIRNINDVTLWTVEQLWKE